MKGIVSTPDSLTSTKTRRVYPFVFIANDVELQKKADILFKQSLEQVNHRVLNENNLDCIMGSEFAKEEFGHWIDGIPYQMQAGVEFDHGQFKDMVNSMLDDNYHGQEKDVYFYHSDHLGSASWITDFSGMAVQHIQYLPYGEPYVNQHPFGYSERFTFTGKERDEEAGYNYHGARYYDAALLAGWLSVDPLADKYPSISPYAYCANNPVKLVDEEGEFPRLPFWIRAAFSKQVRQAVSYKMKQGGNLSVWESRGGCVFASVSTNTYTKNSVTISEKMFRPEGYSSEAQIKPTTDIFTNIETWMDEPAISIGNFGLKAIADLGYSMINEPTKVLTGSSLSGTEATPDELSEAFVGTVASGLGSFLSKGMGTIKTIGKTGLDKYNDFVKQMGNYQGKSKRQMGQLYQKNKNLSDAIITYKKAEVGINVSSSLKTED